MYILLREHSGKVVNRGGISVPQMTKDVFHLSYSQSRPLLISDCHWNVIQGNNIGVTAYPSGSPVFSPGFYGGSCFGDRCLMFCPIFWPFYCLYFVDLLFLINPFVSSYLS